jgi:uncharacterized short protein YbdD (DUF466 family)
VRLLNEGRRTVSGALAAGAAVREAARRLRRIWLQVIGAPDYERYLAHHAAHHPDTPPMSERDYVKLFIERKYNGPGASRCC